MGLFDGYTMSPEANQGLLNFGLGLLANSRGQSTSEALGRAGMMGLQAYQGAKDRQYSDKLRSMQMSQAEEQDRIRKLQASAMQSATTGAQDAIPAFKGAPGLLAEPGKVDFQKYQGLLAQGGDVQGALSVQSLLAKENRAPSIVPNGATAIDPATGRVIYSSPKEFGPTAQPAPSDLGKLVQEMQALPPNSPMRQSYMDRIKALTTAPDQSVPVSYQEDASGSYVALPGKVPMGQTPTPMPTGVKAMPKPSATSTAVATEDERKAAGWLSQAQNAWKNMQAVAFDKSGKLTPDAKPGVIESTPMVPEGLRNMTRSDGRQKFLQGASSMSEALLRAATGAGVNRDEAAQKIRELTPQWGDSEDNIKQKMDSIPMYLESLRVRAGRAAPSGVQPGAQARQVTRTGMHNGRKVNQYSDGSIEYAQ